MAKITTISITNFKAISDLEMDFKGSTAIITGANNSGKTSFLRGIPDRIRFIRPDVMVKKGEKEGRGEMVLDTGEKFIWEFNDTTKDKLTYITHDGSQRQSVTKELGQRFFPVTFDIDKFLQSSPKAQAKQLQAIVGLDFTDIDKRYEDAYNTRTEKNRDAELYHLKLEKMIKCDRVEPVDLTKLQSEKAALTQKFNDEYKKNQKVNEDLRKEWNDAKVKIDTEVREFNDKQTSNRILFNSCADALHVLSSNGYQGDAYEFVKTLENKIEANKRAVDLYPIEPNWIEEMPSKEAIEKIDALILTASQTNTDAQKYKEYIDHKNATESAKDIAKEWDEKVKSIESERQKMLESAKMPQGISVTSEGVTVDGLPLDRNQISTSKLYTSALRIASINLGEVKTLYFDASFLDKVSLSEIEAWAQSEGLQLLIERPDFEAGEIKYELIETI